MRSRTIGTMLATGALSLAAAAPAAAHITTNPAEGPADGYATVNFQVPHGCEESPTTRVRIKVPPSVPTATPQVHPLWDLTTKEGRKDKVDLHGETITRGVSEIIYTAKQPLPVDRMDVMGVSLKLPAGEEGDSVYFPTIQECKQGETRWIQIPAEGQSEEELEDPAPAVVLTEETASAEPASDVQAAGTTVNESDGAPTWLVVVALALGALGLATGVAGLAAARRNSA